MDFQSFLDGFDFSKNAFMFVDPPYNCAFTQYDTVIFDRTDQERLATFLLEYKAKFMLGTQYKDMMKELYKSKNLYIQIYAKKYRFNIKRRFPRRVKHVFITHYDTNTRV